MSRPKTFNWRLARRHARERLHPNVRLHNPRERYRRHARKSLRPRARGHEDDTGKGKTPPSRAPSQPARENQKIHVREKEVSVHVRALTTRASEREAGKSLHHRAHLCNSREQTRRHARESLAFTHTFTTRAKEQGGTQGKVYALARALRTSASKRKRGKISTLARAFKTRVSERGDTRREVSTLKNRLV